MHKLALIHLLRTRFKELSNGPCFWRSRFSNHLMRKTVFQGMLIVSVLVLIPHFANAGSATWDLNPGSGDWNTATNWTPPTVPNGSADTAIFALSNTTGVSLSANTEVNGITFTAGATSPYTITVNPSVGINFRLIISGDGITNNSGILQNFVTTVASNYAASQIYFRNSATAGSAAAFTNNGGIGSGLGGAGGSSTFFRDNSTAANGTFTNNGGMVSGASGGNTGFEESATAANGTFTNNGAMVAGAFGGNVYFLGGGTTAASGIFTNNGGMVSGAYGGYTTFSTGATAANGTFTNNGGMASGAFGGAVTFYDASSTDSNGTFINNGGAVDGALGGKTVVSYTSTAGSATLIANGGQGGGQGGTIVFEDRSTGGTSRVEVFGNGSLDISTHNPPAPGVTIGSIEGDGNVFLGAKILTVGNNNLSTTFSGVIQEGGLSGDPGGSLAKIGSGTLTLQGGATNDHIADPVTLRIVSGSTINLNFTGSPDAVVALLVDGVAQIPGLYGSAASGATHPLPQFVGTGKILVTGPLAVSRKMHDGDTFDLYLPLAGSAGIECRSGGPDNNYELIATFLNAVTFTSADVTSGTGSVASTVGNGTTVVTIDLAGVANAQRITVTLFDVDNGKYTADVDLQMAVLTGDTNGDGLVDSSDIAQTKSQLGSAVTVSNFREDVTTNGFLNSGDIALVKSKSGTALP